MLTMKPRGYAGAGGVQASTTGQLLIPEPCDDGRTGRGFGWPQPLPKAKALHPWASQAAAATATATATVLLQTYAVIVVADAVIKGLTYTFYHKYEVMPN